jgi:hypothetical protein
MVQCFLGDECGVRLVVKERVNEPFCAGAVYVAYIYRYDHGADLVVISIIHETGFCAVSRSGIFWGLDIAPFAFGFLEVSMKGGWVRLSTNCTGFPSLAVFRDMTLC